MSVWNAVLQATHSTLIDQLNETFPDDKLELGLPKRFDSWGVTEGPDHFFYQEVITDEGSGMIVLAIRSKDIQIGTEVFGKMIARAEKEFKLRKIEVSFGKLRKEVPSSLRMTIWLPIRIVKTSSEIFDLAVAI